MDSEIKFNFSYVYDTKGKDVTKDDMMLETQVAGISYRVKYEDLDTNEMVCQGHIEKEPDNPKDCNAIAVYTAAGKHIGYVPKENIGVVSDFTEGQDMPCWICFSPFLGDNNEVCVKAKAVLLKLFEGKNEELSSLMEEQLTSLAEEALGNVENLSAQIKNVYTDKFVEEGEDFVSDHGFLHVICATAEQSEKTGCREDDVLEFEITNINQFQSAVFYESDDEGLSVGYVLGRQIFQQDDVLLSAVPEEMADKVDEWTKGRKTYCMYYVRQAIGQDGRIRLNADAKLLRLYEDDEDYNLSLIGEYALNFMRFAIEKGKAYVKQVAKLTQHGEQLEYSDEYTKHMKAKNAQQKSGCAASIALCVLAALASLLAACSLV